MFGFIYDLLIVLLTAAMGYYFLHASKMSPEKRKLKFWGFASIVLGTIFLLVSLIRNVILSSSQQIPSSKDSTIAYIKPDTVKKFPRDSIPTESTRKPKAQKTVRKPTKGDGDRIEIKTYGQTGGTNIGKIDELHIHNDIQEPQYTLTQTIDREPRGNTFHSEFTFVIHSNNVLPSLGIEARSPGIIKLEILHETVWTQFNVREGHVDDSLIWRTFTNASPGKYCIKVDSKGNNPVYVEPFIEK